MQTIPSFTRSAWDRVKRRGKLHPGLSFYRFLELDNERRYKDALELMKSQTSIPFASDLATRLQRQVGFLKNCGWESDTFEAELITRMAVGLGIPSLTENGLWLDHTHGIPLIPGSVLKGVAQDYALMEKSGGNPSQIGLIKREDPEFVILFGAQTPSVKGEVIDKYFEARQGQVVFFDAFPLNNINPFDIDIINPHYGEYFAQSGGAPPADYLSPNPILFLTVKTGIRFRFALAARSADFRLKKSDGSEIGAKFSGADLLAKARNYLTGALSNLGVGGKTRVGYGLFKV